MNKISLNISKKQTALGSLEEKLQQIKLSLADMGMDAEKCCEDESVSKEDLERLASAVFSNLDSMYNMVNRVYDRIYAVEDNAYKMYYNHLKGHLPAINSVEQMGRAIEALGLGDEVEVQKRVIYASDGKAEKLVVEIPIK